MKPASKNKTDISVFKRANHLPIHGTFSKDGKNKLIAIHVGDLRFDFIGENQPFLSVKFMKAFSKALGFPNSSAALDVIFDIAEALPTGMTERSFNRIIALIADQKPKDSVEATLLGQFFLQNEIGTHSLKKSHNSDMLCHAEYYSKTAAKFFALSHRTVYALAKHKTKGTQQVNVVHMHDDSKAILAGEIGGRGTCEK